MSLSDWEEAGWLVVHKTDRTEIRDLLNLADRDLRCATAALAAAGYRAVRDQRHYRTIQSLEYTLGVDNEMIPILDAFRKKRNISDYERSGCVSITEAREMFALARMLRNTVREWIRETHPHLVEE